jgi:hypothetical protein
LKSLATSKAGNGWPAAGDFLKGNSDADSTLRQIITAGQQRIPMADGRIAFLVDNIKKYSGLPSLMAAA